MGLKIAMIPVDECYKEVCESGGCTNVLKTTNQPLLIQTNGTSLVGVTSYIVAECVCAARTFSNEPLKCETGSCLNGGKCVNFIGGTGFRWVHMSIFGICQRQFVHRFCWWLTDWHLNRRVACPSLKFWHYMVLKLGPMTFLNGQS